MRKMLIGIHHKSCSLRAVAHVPKQYLDAQHIHKAAGLAICVVQ